MADPVNGSGRLFNINHCTVNITVGGPQPPPSYNDIPHDGYFDNGPGFCNDDVGAGDYHEEYEENFTPDQQEYQPYYEEIPVDTEYLEYLLALHPWPPPEWDTIEGLHPDDLATLRETDFTNISDVTEYCWHLTCSAKHQRANRKLRDRQEKEFTFIEMLRQS